MSTFVWIDHSEKQRRQILEAIDMFREKDTRDELGLAGIRDTFSDMLFPGTGTLQTRARYFFFIPWMYLKFEADGIRSSEVARRGRAFELALVESLLQSPDPLGTIGRVARAALQRLPSSVYWNGLKLLGIRQFSGSQTQYHQSFDQRNAARTAVRRNDDGEVVGAIPRAWHAGLPSPPPTFPSAADFDLASAEALYLRSRILETHRASLFAFLLDRDYEDFDCWLVWEHPATEQVPAELRRAIEHARNYSEVMHGASILYNLYLAQLEPRRENVIDECGVMFDDWLGMMAQRRPIHETWDREDFWKLLATHSYAPSTSTSSFVEAWCKRAVDENAASLREREETRKLISEREVKIKGPLARFTSRRAREIWNGGSGLGQLSYRWSNARVILRDIAEGLAGNNA